MKCTAWQEIRISESAGSADDLTCPSVTRTGKSVLTDSQPLCVSPFFPSGTLPCSGLGVRAFRGPAAWPVPSVLLYSHLLIRCCYFSRSAPPRPLQCGPLEQEDLGLEEVILPGRFFPSMCMCACSESN